MDVNAVLQAEGKIGNSPVQFLLDSGAAVSVICCDMVPVSAMRRMEPASSSTVAANGLPLDVVGQVSVPVSLSGYCVTHTFLVVRGLTVEGLLGADFLEKHRAVIDFADRRLTLGMQGDNIPVQITKDTQPDTPHSTMTIMVSSTTEVPGRSVKLISGHVNGLCTVDSGLVEPHWEQNTPKHLMLGRCLSAVQEGQVTLEFTNTSPGTVTLPHGMRVGLFTPLATIHVVGETPVSPQESERPPVNVDLSKALLATTQKEELQSLLNRFAHVFVLPGEPPGRTRVTKHDIKVSAPPHPTALTPPTGSIERGGPTGSPEHA